MANIVNINGVKIIQTSEYVEINGERIAIPYHVRCKTQTMSVKNNVITINGYVLDVEKKTFIKPNFIHNFFKMIFG